MSEPAAVIGVISDTHGLLRPEAIDALGDVELIVHAGDIGPPEILGRLGELAPVHAVRGNVDRAAWARALPETEVVTVAGRDVYVIHDIAGCDVDAAAAGFAAVIYGHSHQPGKETRGEVLYLNPGSAGPRRFALPVSVARLHLGAGGARAEIIELKV